MSKTTAEKISEMLDALRFGQVFGDHAWVLNGIRPALEAARETYTEWKGKAREDAFRYMDATTTDIIDPLYTAFTEARDGTH